MEFNEVDASLAADYCALMQVDHAKFAKFLRTCEHDRQDWRPKAGRVSITHYALTDDDGICGFGRLIFPLSGTRGNLEFEVPPSRRGQEFGTVILNKLLFEAVRAGLARALVVCAEESAATRRAIERNRGELEACVNGQCRYWIRFR